MTAKKRTKKTAAGRTRTKPGDVIEKTFKGKAIKVTVNDDGYRYGRKTYPSLTAVAKHITGYKAVSGPAFFGLTKRDEGQG